MGNPDKFSTPFTENEYTFGNNRPEVEAKYKQLYLALENLQPLLSGGQGLQARREEVNERLKTAYSRAVPHLDLVNLMRTAGFSDSEMRDSLVMEPFNIEQSLIDRLLSVEK
jgi:hypothetical protein